MLRPWLYSVLGLAGFLVGAYVLLTFGLPLVLPFAIALFLAELIDPLIARLTWRGKVPRSAAVAVVLILFVSLITFAMTAAVGRLLQEIQSVMGQLPYLSAMALDVGKHFAEQFGAFSHSLPASIQLMMEQNLAKLQMSLSEKLPGVHQTLAAFSTLPSVVTNLLIALIATFFMSRDKREINGFLLSLFPKEWRPKLSQVKDQVWVSSIGWAKAQLTLVLITMIQTTIGLSLIGSRYSVIMGIVVAFADLLPVLGPATIYLPWIMYCFIFGSKVFGLKLLFIYLFVAGVRQILEPKLVGDQIGLHPLAILVSLYLGFHFFGALGFVAGPLLAILLKALIKSGLLPIFQDELPKS